MDYIHGFDGVEQDRLLRQADFLAPFFLGGMDLGACQRALEIGCGVGAQMRLLLRRFPSLEIQGIDRLMAQVDGAQRVLQSEITAGRARVQHADGTRLPFAQETFDAVYLVFVLEHASDPVSLLREAYKVLRPGGLLYAAEVFNQSFYVYPPAPYLTDYWRAFNEQQYRLGGDPNIGPKLANMALTAGFDIQRFEVVDFLLDGRITESRVRHDYVQYWRDLLASVSPALRLVGAADNHKEQSIAVELDRVEHQSDGVLLYNGRFLAARKKS